MPRFASILILATAVAGCGPRTPFIPDSSANSARSALAGEWFGTFAVDEGTPRRGTILFLLDERRDEASGRVVMAADDGVPVQRYPGEHGAGAARDGWDVVAIRFVRLTRYTIEGELDRFWDARRGCVATTVFRGTLDGDAINGTFVTGCQTTVLQNRGSWAVRRLRR